MKLIAAFILIVLVMVQTFTSWLLIAEYTINKDYIAQNLCINKAKPKLQCKGKCQLMKKLVEEESQNSSSDTKTNVKIKMSEVLFLSNFQIPSVGNLLKENPGFHSAYILKHSSGAIPSIFHPPAVS